MRVVHSVLTAILVHHHTHHTFQCNCRKPLFFPFVQESLEMSYVSHETQHIIIPCAHPIESFITKKFIEGTSNEKKGQSRY
jgi:hypothetical protein